MVNSVWAILDTLIVCCDITLHIQEYHVVLTMLAMLAM